MATPDDDESEKIRAKDEDGVIEVYDILQSDVGVVAATGSMGLDSEGLTGLWPGWPVMEPRSSASLVALEVDECLFLGSEDESLDASRRHSPAVVTEEDAALLREAVGPLLYDVIVDEFLAGCSDSDAGRLLARTTESDLLPRASLSSVALDQQDLAASLQDAPQDEDVASAQGSLTSPPTCSSAASFVSILTNKTQLSLSAPTNLGKDQDPDEAEQDLDQDTDQSETSEASVIRADKVHHNSPSTLCSGLSVGSQETGASSTGNSSQDSSQDPPDPQDEPATPDTVTTLSCEHISSPLESSADPLDPRGSTNDITDSLCDARDTHHASQDYLGPPDSPDTQDSMETRRSSEPGDGTDVVSDESSMYSASSMLPITPRAFTSALTTAMPLARTLWASRNTRPHQQAAGAGAGAGAGGPSKPNPSQSLPNHQTVSRERPTFRSESALSRSSPQ